MRHNVAGRLFGRTANQRKALLRGLAGALIQNERIETTLAKAKETRRIVEKLVTLGKKGDLNSKRVAMAKLPDRGLVQKLFDKIAPRFADRNGGYLRIVQTRQRVNDASHMAIIEFVDYEETKAASSTDTESKKDAAAPAEKAEKKAAAKKAATKKPATKKAATKKTATKKASAKKAPATKKASTPRKMGSS